MKLIKAILAGLMATFSTDLYRYGCAAEPSKYNLADLLNALAIVESNGEPNTVGDFNEAIGIYQIHKIYVDDVNRILRQPRFSYADRWNVEKSRQMVTIYLLYYAGNKGIEGMAAIHCAGPNGWKKYPHSEKIQQYVKKVMRVLESGKVETD